MGKGVRDDGLAVEDASNICFLEPAFTPRGDNQCAKLLSSHPSHDTTLLFVTVTRSVDSRLESWQSHVDGELPPRVGVVDLRGSSQTTDDRPLAAADRTDSEIRIETVKDPGNLTKIGIILSTYISDWAHEGDRVILCFDSLTALLQFADLKPIYRFIREVADLLQEFDALAHYHIDPGAHDEQVVNRLMALFDAAVERDEEGEWRIRGAAHSK